MAKRWIAVVTRVDAKMFSERPFKRVSELRNLLGREKDRAMTRDKPTKNRSIFAGYKGMHTTGGEKSPHEDSAVAFAKRISEFLRKARAGGRFDELLLVAEPKMLGRVKKEMDKTLLACTDWVRKDLGHVKNAEIPGVLGLRRSRNY